ncbi:tRNA N6-adenosine threonylcarbamoyltransferase [Mycobacterium talmoniae]|uniref:tRNA N6-adenosine threonylcarbamoyltransferase n=1 Tax=Mycobacterium talmoniae TaxID=1858794 RepID=A0A2S8BKZ7_9MYCO|nr:tRNA N6-adenosine threonylcarbamoyltransferase [Mycobacterium talmoniae]
MIGVMAANNVDIAGTVRERAARELRNRILTGALPPGVRLDLDAITEEFATSRTPVREALLELSYEGLVRVAPRSGVTVIGISPDDVLDSFTILGVLTGQAAAWAAERLGAEEVARLRELAEQRCAAAGLTLRIPAPRLCTDNGAMIASFAAHLLAAGAPPSPLDAATDPGLPVVQGQVA